MTKEQILEALEEMPLGKTCKLRLGMTPEALEFIRKDYPDATMEDIKLYNEKAEEWERGFSDAVQRYREWRNDLYLKIKAL